MKVNKYTTKLNDDGSATIIGYQGNLETEICSFQDADKLNGSQLDERVKLELRLHDVEVGTVEESIYMDNQKIDLSLVRAKMRTILKELSDKNVPLSKRKESLDIYQQMCSSAQIIVNVCKLELEIDKTSKDGKKR